MGNSHPNIVPYQDFRTADGFMILTVGNDGQFANLCRILGRPEWSADERFATNAQRVRHRAELVEMIDGATRTRTTSAWIALMEEAGVPCGPINTIDDVFADPQVTARAMRMDMPHPVAGSVPLVANPVRFSVSRVDYRRSPPRLGEHSAEVLQEWLGMS